MVMLTAGEGAWPFGDKCIPGLWCPLREPGWIVVGWVVALELRRLGGTGGK